MKKVARFAVPIILTALLIILFSLSASAGAIDVDSKRVTDRTPAGGDAVFTVSITNNQIKDDIIKITADDLSLYPFSDVASSIRANPSQITAPSKKRVNVEVTVKTLDGLRPNKNYIVYAWAKSVLNPDIGIKFPLTLYAVSPQELIDIIAEMPSEVAPGTNIAVDATFKNNANEKLENLDVYITSSVFSDEDKITLESLKDLNKEYRFSIPSNTQAGQYSFSIRVYHNGVLKGVYTKDFAISESTDIKETISTSRGFLSSTINIAKTNEGNIEIEKTVKHPVNWFTRIFTSIEPEAELIKEDGKKYYQWNFMLKPGESYEIKIKTDYKILFVIVLVVLGLIALRLYYKYKTLSIEKKIFKISDNSEGISELKILLHINNKTNKDVHHIKIIDLLPNFIKPSTDFGTLKPINIQRGSSGMRLIWEINSLEPGEERIISYKVHSKIHVVGRITLPAASVQYRTTGKRLVNVKSNKLVYVPRRE